MININHTHRTSFQSSSPHNQPLQKFYLLHATLQQNNCTSSEFPAIPVTLRAGQVHSNQYETVKFSLFIVVPRFNETIL